MENFGGVASHVGFLEGGVENPPMFEIEVPVRLAINFEDKKLPVQELASSLSGLESALLGRVLEEIDVSLVNSICGKEYGKNDYHRHDSDGRTVVTQLGETSFEVSRVKDKSTGSTFYPLYRVIDFRGGKYQDDVSAVSVDFALSMSYRDATNRLDRTNQAPSPSTVWRRVQELGEGEKGKEVEHNGNGFVSADGTKLHSQQGKKLDAKVVAGENFVVGVNEKYRNMSKTDVLAVGDADDELDCFEKRQLDLIHVPTEANHKLWQHGVDLDTRKEYINRVKGILLSLKNSLENHDLENRIKKTEEKLERFATEMEDKGYWRLSRFFRKHTENMLLFAYKKLEGIDIPWHNNWMERLMGEISKRMKNKWMSWSPRGAKNLLNLLLKRYVEKDNYESFIQNSIGKNYRVEVKFHI